mmetsp:Transcript_34027/g.101665  ORF Transcript_34027/g.101665 Transcript_34027/m.101665 type:complete len:224 (+) Transcript_34027:206-877(+)
MPPTFGAGVSNVNPPPPTRTFGAPTLAPPGRSLFFPAAGSASPPSPPVVMAFRTSASMSQPNLASKSLRVISLTFFCIFILCTNAKPCCSDLAWSASRAIESCRFFTSREMSSKRRRIVEGSDPSKSDGSCMVSVRSEASFLEAGAPAGFAETAGAATAAAADGSFSSSAPRMVRAAALRRTLRAARVAGMVRVRFCSICSFSGNCDQLLRLWQAVSSGGCSR